MALSENIWGNDKYEDMIKGGALKPAEDIVTDNIEFVRADKEEVTNGVKKLSKREKDTTVVTSVQDVINDTMAKCFREQAMTGIIADNNADNDAQFYIDDDIDELDEDNNAEYEVDCSAVTSDNVDNEYFDDTVDDTEWVEDEDEFVDTEDNPFINIPTTDFTEEGFSSLSFGFGDTSKSSISTVDMGVLDYLHKIEENVDKTTEGIVDMPTSSLSTLLNAMVAIITNSAEILEILSNKLSEADKKLSSLYHACEFSSAFVSSKLKIACFDEIHKIRMECREIKKKYSLISAVRDNSVSLCKKFKPSILSAIDKAKNPEDFKPQYEVDLYNRLIDGDDSDLNCEESA